MNLHPCDMPNNIKLKSVSRHCRLRARFIEPLPNTAMLSISRPNDPAKLKDGWQHLLRLEFHDIGTEHPELIAFNDDMAKELIDWLAHIENKVEHLYIHCFAGISRSAAITKFIIEHYKLSITHTSLFYNKHVYRSLCSKKKAICLPADLTTSDKHI